jgi:RHS repeat-associated protein
VAKSAYQYDGLNRLTDLDHTDAVDAVLASYDFEYDAASRIVALTDIEGRTDFSYDSRNQLTAADRSIADPRRDEAYAFDAAGNRTSSSRNATGYVTGVGNRLLSDGTFNYEYDKEGNQSRRTNIATSDFREFQYDHRNRLTRVTDFSAGGVITQDASYTYDALNRRIAKTVDANGADPGIEQATYFVYDGANVLLDFVDADGAAAANQPVLTARYLFGPSVDQVLAKEDVLAGQTLWLLADHLGTIRDIVNDAGAVLNRIAYDSFGNVLSQTDPLITTRYLFTGREFDAETGLYYYRARYYDANIGRFMSEDPIGFASGDANLFRYVGNSPLQSTDPSGTTGKVIGGLKSGLIGGVKRGAGGVETGGNVPKAFFKGAGVEVVKSLFSDRAVAVFDGVIAGARFADKKNLDTGLELGESGVGLGGVLIKSPALIIGATSFGVGKAGGKAGFGRLFAIRPIGVLFLRASGFSKEVANETVDDFRFEAGQSAHRRGKLTGTNKINLDPRLVAANENTQRLSRLEGRIRKFSPRLLHGRKDPRTADTKADIIRSISRAQFQSLWTDDK